MRDRRRTSPAYKLRETGDACLLGGKLWKIEDANLLKISLGIQSIQHFIWDYVIHILILFIYLNFLMSRFIIRYDKLLLQITIVPKVWDFEAFRNHAVLIGGGIKIPKIEIHGFWIPTFYSYK